MSRTTPANLVNFGNMRNPFKSLLIVLLPLQLICKAWLANHPDWVERWYSLKVYPAISQFFRRAYGPIPFSVGDLLYLVLLSIALIYVFRYSRNLKTHFWDIVGNVLALFSVLHLTFYLLWGLNYFRLPLGKSLGLEEKFSTSELVAYTQNLVETSNTIQLKLTGDSINPVLTPYTYDEIFLKTLESYQLLAQKDNRYSYINPSIKPSLISQGLSFMGYGGYLNPFTGEAQVNALIPTFRLPVVSAHEIGHQLGYSAENETNFIGFLATRENPDPYFQYSAATFALNYCLSELHRRDSLAVKRISSQLNPGVKANFSEVYAFWRKYENPAEPIFKAMFNRYLEANRQKDSIGSYNRIVALLIAQHRMEKQP